VETLLMFTLFLHGHAWTFAICDESISSASEMICRVLAQACIHRPLSWLDTAYSFTAA
jgi:hypothetical protein